MKKFLMILMVVLLSWSSAYAMDREFYAAFSGYDMDNVHDDYNIETGINIFVNKIGFGIGAGISDWDIQSSIQNKYVTVYQIIGCCMIKAVSAGKLDFIPKAGVKRLLIEDTDDETTWFAGMDIDWNIDDNAAVFISYSYMENIHDDADDPDLDADIISVGIKCAF